MSTSAGTSDRDRDRDRVGVEDLLPVRSRVSWGAILAGAVVALAVYFLLTLLGGAIGFSVSDRIRPENLGSGAAVWAILTTVLSLFLGGWVASQLAVGESRGEAILYGIILWGVLFGMLLWLMASGVRAGFNALIGMANAGAAAASGTIAEDWEAAARRAGMPQEKIDEWRRKAAGAPEAARPAEDPRDWVGEERAAEAATRVTWWAFLGTLFSMLAAVAGAYIGAGPKFRLLAAPVRRTTSGGTAVP